jgi:hypothetical protein
MTREQEGTENRSRKERSVDKTSLRSRERYGGDLLQGEKRTALSCAEAKNKRRGGAERKTN